MKNFYNNNGYYISQNIVDKNYQEEFFYLLYDLALSSLKRNKMDLNKYPKTEDIKYPSDIKNLDKLLIKLLAVDKEIIAEIYDVICYSSLFLRFISEKKFEDIAKELIDIPKKTAIYSWKHRMRIDPPQDNRRTYGWHQEIFYNMPKVPFIQMWCPLIRDATDENGTISICPESHKEGIANSKWIEKAGIATQVLINDAIVNKYSEKKIEMQTGDIMFFDPHLFHRSGNNISSEVRFSLVGMWNDTRNNFFRAPKPNFTKRGYEAKEYFNEIFGSRKN